VTKENGITVKSDAFIVATNKITMMKRAPKGSRSQMPTDTLISRAGDKLKIETPVAENLIDFSGIWHAVVSVDARLLAKAAQSHGQSDSLKISLNGVLQISSVHTKITHNTTVPILSCV